MTTTILSDAATTVVRLPFLQRLLRDRVVDRLKGLKNGALAFSGNGSGGEVVCGAADGALGCARIEVRDGRFWSAVALGGALGAGESFSAGHWRSDDPARVVRIMLRDRQVLDACESGIGSLFAPLLKVWHALRPNSISGSKKNIAAHYDLGNDFFSMFLDPSMTYSSAVFAPEDVGASPANLQKSQGNKLRRLCQKLALSSKDRLLEIGTGWGSMAMCAAGEFSANVTTTTISRRQFDLARERFDRAGLSDRIQLVEQDYRALQGQFDKLVNCEMVEAVGHQFLPGFFGRCAELLRPGGVMAMQAITIQDQQYKAALKHVDFIKRYVFPGSFIPSVTALVDASTEGSDFRLVHMEDFSRHYAETLRQWRELLLQNRPAIMAAGYDDQFLRTWEWYLAYCEGGFAEGYLGLAQLVFARPGSSHAVDSAALAPVAADPYRG